MMPPDTNELPPDNWIPRHLTSFVANVGHDAVGTAIYEIYLYGWLSAVPVDS
jgi:hypothetical protein